MSDTTQEIPRLDQDEIRDWLDSLDAVIDRHGLTATGRLLQELTRRAEHAGVQLPFTANTPYLNTVPRAEEPAYPGDRDLEHRLKSLIRWNALAMVVRANRHADGIGGHISTYASAATLYEVGFQRVGDLIWAAADSRCRGFLLGGTAGRTTLAGEGLQHQDGQSHLLAYPVPNLLAYDPAYAYELAVIIEDGIRRMYVEGESVFYYLTVENQPYPMPKMPEGARAGILKGLYRLRPATATRSHRAQLLASGAILREALEAQTLLEGYDVAADVWSVTSWAQLYRDGHACDRWNLLHPLEPPRQPYVTQCLGPEPGVVVAASDYLKALPDSLSQWLDTRLVALGTDGFGRSDTREALREFFEVDARFITVATLRALARDGAVPLELVARAIGDLGIDPEKADPARS